MKRQTPALFQTGTPVHTEESMRRQREKAEIRENGVLYGLSLYGQIMIGCAMYLYDHVATPGYLSLVLIVPFLLLIFAWCAWLRRRKPGDVFAAAGPGAGRLLAACWGALCWLDGQLAFYALCAMVSHLLPTVSTLQAALAIAVTAAFALGGQGGKGLCRLSRLMALAVFFGIAVCAATALPYGETGHLFPLLGHGGKSIFRGGVWMCGCGAGACLPLLFPGRERKFHTPGEEKARLLPPVLGAAGMGMLSALLSAYLLPIYALARPETMGYRLLLPARISPSVAAWSLLVCAMLLLMLTTMGTGVLGCGRLLARAAGKKKIPLSLTAGILLSYVPWGALNIQPLEGLLLRLSPVRSVLLLLLLLALSAATGRRKEKNAPEREAQP